MNTVGKLKIIATSSHLRVLMKMCPGIDEYSFGRMVVAGREFTSDLIIHLDGRIQDNWWRAEGHSLRPGDIASVLDEAPKKLIVGTGAGGLMSVSRGVKELCDKLGIEIESCRTSEAVTRFNEEVKNGTVVAACFHLTC